MKVLTRQWDKGVKPELNGIALLDFDLGYSKEKIYALKSSCLELNEIKIELITAFFNKNFGNIEELKKKNAKPIKDLIVFLHEVKSWCKAEKEAIEASHMLSNWYKMIMLQVSKRLSHREK